VLALTGEENDFVPWLKGYSPMRFTDDWKYLYLARQHPAQR